MFMRIAFGTNMFLGICFEHMFYTIPYVHKDLFIKKSGEIGLMYSEVFEICLMYSEVISPK